MTLTLLGLALSVVIILMLCVPLLGRKQSGEKRSDYELAVYKDQIKELGRDRERGLLGDDQAALARAEIERRLLAADARSRQDSGYHGGRKTTAIIVAATLLIPAIAVVIYLGLGRPGLPDMPFASRTDIQATQGVSQEKIDAMLQTLRDRLARNPDNAEGWTVLGRALMSLGKLAEARDSLHKAFVLTGDPYLAADAAEADVLLNDQTVRPEALKAFTALRKHDPLDPKSRYYIGLADEQAGNPARALQEWVDLIEISPSDAPWLGSVHEQVLRLAKEMGTDPKTLKPSEDARKLAETAPPATAPQAGAATDSGSAAIPGPTAEDVKRVQQMSPEDQDAFIRSMVQRLADRLQQNPDDPAGWRKLARAYRMLGEDVKAADALKHAKAAESASQSEGSKP